MSRDGRDADDDGRFKPGRSGNPRGRPRRSAPVEPALSELPIARKLLAEAKRSIQIREGGEVKTISTVEAVARAQAKTALEGGQYAQERFLEKAQKLERHAARDLEDERRLWRMYVVARHGRGIDDRFTADDLPHPDDVVIPARGPVRFVGPLDKEGLDRLKESIAYRDLMILWDQLETRGAKAASGKGRARGGTALLFAQALDMSLAPRFRMSDVDFAMATVRAERLTLRAIRTTIRRELGRLGKSRPPRDVPTLPPLEFATRKIRLCSTLAEKRATGQWVIEAMPAERLARHLMEVERELE